MPASHVLPLLSFPSPEYALTRMQVQQITMTSYFGLIVSWFLTFGEHMHPPYSNNLGGKNRGLTLLRNQ